MLELSPLLQQRVNQWMMVIATLQGLLMLLLYRAHVHDYWLVQDMVYAVPLWTLVLTLPVFLILSLESGNVVAATGYSAGLSGLLVASGLYTGLQLQTEQDFSSGSVLGVFTLGMVLAAFKGVMYVQQRASGEALSYPLLFSLSWRNFLVMALALLFVGIVALLLLLWAALFDAIGVSFFEYLFTKDWFLFPTLGFAFGVGVALFRQLAHIIDNITRLLQALIRFLLPLLVLMSSVFLVSLLVVGMDTLWQTGFGTGLILWLMAVLLFFVNAVYQDGRGDPAYSLGVHRLIYFGLLGLPVLAGLSLYGLTLRIDQYGLTVERVYAVVVWLLLSLFAIGYGVSIVMRRDLWTEGLAVVNTRMGLVVLGAMLTLNSPLLDPRKLTVSSQLARLDAGTLTLEQLDVPYFMRHLAKPGADALDELRLVHGADHPALKGRTPYDYQAIGLGQPVPRPQADTFWVRATIRPEGTILPPELIAAIDESNRFMGYADATIIATNLNDDAEKEYLVFSAIQNRIVTSRYFVLQDGLWRSGGLQMQQPGMMDATIISGLQPEDIELEPPLVNNVRIGNLVFQATQPGTKFSVSDTVIGIPTPPIQSDRP